MTNMTRISIAVLAILSLLVGGWFAFRHFNNEDPVPPCACIICEAEEDSVAIAIDRDALIAEFEDVAVVQTILALDAIGRENNRTFTGIAIRDILVLYDVNLDCVPATAILTLTTVNAAGDAHSNTPATHAIASPANFLAADTLLAWYEVNLDNDTSSLLERPRLVFGNDAAVLWGQFSQRVTAMTLTF